MGLCRCHEQKDTAAGGQVVCRRELSQLLRSSRTELFPASSLLCLIITDLSLLTFASQVQGPGACFLKLKKGKNNNAPSRKLEECRKKGGIKNM